MDATIHRLHMASTRYLDGRIDVYAYLIVTDTDFVLIDTGVGEGNRYIDKHFEPRITPVADTLQRHGVRPEDITLLVNSHLHFDHCGNNRLFPNAEIHVQSAELEVARGEGYTVQAWFDYKGARLNPVDGDADLCRGIKLIATPGHTPGHQSVLVDCDQGPYLVVAQAAYTIDEYNRGGDPVEQAHPGLERQYVETIASLKQIQAARLFLSHDARES